MNYANIDIIAQDYNKILAVVSDNPFKYIVGIELEDGEIDELGLFNDILEAAKAYKNLG